MCQFKSGVAVKISEDDVKIFTLKGEDSHTEIRKEYNIRDGVGAGSTRQTPVELIPVRGLLKKEDYKFVFDAYRPDWWTDNMTVSATNQLFSAVLAEIVNNTIKYEGSLDLRSLTTLPKGITIEVGENINLDSLEVLPEGAILKAGEDIYINSLTSMSKGATIKVGRYIDLNSLTTLPKGVTIKSRNTFLKNKII